MSKLFLLLIWLITANVRADYKLVFEDNFNYFNPDKWSVETGPRHQAIYTEDAVIVKDGNLIIKPFTLNNQYYSAIVTTENKFEFNQGYLEARIKFNDCKGTWSDLWLYNKNVAKDEKNVLVNGIEIDILEHRLYDSNLKNISGFVNHVIHYDGYGKFHKHQGIDTGNLNLDKDFNVYSFLWDEYGYRFFVNGKETWKLAGPKTNAKLFILISTEIGELPGWTPKPLKSINQETIIVDCIRVYKNE